VGAVQGQQRRGRDRHGGGGTGRGCGKLKRTVTEPTGLMVDRSSADAPGSTGPLGFAPHLRETTCMARAAITPAHSPPRSRAAARLACTQAGGGFRCLLRCRAVSTPRSVPMRFSESTPKGRQGGACAEARRAAGGLQQQLWTEEWVGASAFSVRPMGGPASEHSSAGTSRWERIAVAGFRYAQDASGEAKREDRTR